MKVLVPCLLAFALVWIGCKSDQVDPASPPFLILKDVSIEEGSEPFILNVEATLTEASGEAVTLQYETEAGKALAGEDFVAVAPTTVTIPAGVTAVNLPIEILGDTLRETDEDFLVRISGVSGARTAGTEFTVTLRNDDTFVPGEDEPGIGYLSPMTYPDYDLVWEDAFKGSTLNTDDWNYELGDGCPNLCGWGNNELQYYTDRPENIRLEGGKLIIEARQEFLSGSNYTSARITTQGKQSFRFGRVDIRAKLPEGQGIWPALWMLGESITTVGWPDCGEIDIMELVGHEPSTVHGTIHYDDAGDYKYFGLGTTLDDGSFQDEYHVFSITWDAERIRWYVNNEQFHEANIQSTTMGEFRSPFFLIFNVAVGGNWPGFPDATTQFPQQMVVDYVRVFEAK
ncbi:MAG: glycosyl hydrolase family protein [Bacteroidetes bacterium]|nr:MAG: glycosyl hydrolase family protein [Bacteroidota bacterium]